MEQITKDHTPAWLYDELSEQTEKKTPLFNFSFHGHHANIFIDTAIPLLGFALRVKKLNDCPELTDIYQQIFDEIRAIKIQLLKAKIESAIVNAYSYLLCAFLDEAVFSTPWGANSIWSEHSMLVHFHNETWGGEKFFAILSRLEIQPDNHHPLLEFIYQCLVLGFKGQYNIIENGEHQREKIIKHLRDTLYPIKTEQELIVKKKLTINKKQIIDKQWSIWSVIVFFIIVWSCIFFVYSNAIEQKTTILLQQIEQIL